MLEYYRFKVIHDLFLKGQWDEACMQLKELQKRYVNICEENSALKSRMREYEDILFLARNFVFDGSFYWLITGSIKQGPFCPNCYNRDGQLVRITDMRPRRCAACGEIFELSQSLSKSQRGMAVRALEQSAAVGSLRAFAAIEQMAQATLEQQEAQAKEARKPSFTAPVPGRSRVIRFDPEFRSKCKARG
ncbi:MAG: hypothetical protein LBM64_04380 [Deltaproteobacteria bacterium]|jgi:hypothetical protein|nr:hypothetical protein [Deltaproteobacteria bacterium]